MYITNQRLNRKGKRVAYDKTMFTRPSDDVTPEEKEGKEWNLAWQEYIYTTHLNGGSMISPEQYTRIDLNRSYAYGTQDMQQYLDRFDPTEANPTDNTPSPPNPSKSKRVGYANINPKIVPIIPELRDVFVGLMMSVDHDVVLRAIDPMSAMQKEEELETAFAYKELEPLFKANGIKVEPPDFVPSSKQEMELYLKMGLHKLRYEVALERAVGHAFDQSKWTTYIREKIFGDLFDLNVATVMDKVDEKNQRIGFEYLDPKMVILPYVRKPEYNKYPYGAYQMEMTIADFRAENPDMSEEEVRALAIQYNGVLENPSITLDNPSIYLAKGRCNYDGHVIPVMYACYKTVNRDSVKKRVEIPARKKPVSQKELDSGKIVKDGDKFYKDKVNTIIYRTIYHSKWAIGTQHVWGCGVINDVPRYEDDVVIPIHCVTMNGLSLNERSQPNADNMQMAWLKFQNSWNNAAPKGLIVDEITVTSTADARGLKPKDLLRIRRIQGDMMLNFNPKSSHNLYTKSVNGHPFYEIEGGVGKVLDEFVRTWQWNMSVIQKTIGINEVVDASNPNPEVTKGQAELAVIATNNALKTRYNSYILLKENIVRNAVIRIMRLIYENNDKEKGYYKIIGEPFIESLKIAYKKGLSPSDIGISIKARPTEKELQEIELMLQKAIMSGRNGMPSIKASHYFMIKNIVMEGGGILTAQNMLAMYEAESEREQQEQAMQIQAQAAEEARKTAEAKVMMEEQIAQQQHQREKELLQMKYDLELRNKQAEHENKLIENKINADAELGNKILENQISSGNQSMVQ